MEELIRTAQIVPPADRGQAVPPQGQSVEDIAAGLVGAVRGAPSVEAFASVEEAVAEVTSDRIFELRSSVLFPVNDEAGFSEEEKLELSGAGC